MSAVPPLLRAPPFLHVKPEVAAVSRRDPSVRGDDEDDLLVKAIREARVGGSFWSPPPPVQPRAIVVRAGSRRDVDRYLQTTKDSNRDRLVLLLPQARWARRAARDAGVTHAIGAVDPWPLIESAELVCAPPGDEWLLLAEIAGIATAPIGDAPLPPIDIRAALLDGIAYRDCYSGAAVDALAAVRQLDFWRRALDANRSIAVVAGISWWKRDRIAAFLWTGRREPLHFTNKVDKAISIAKGGGGIGVWPAREPAGLGEATERAGLKLVRIEDGFVRSVGLGSNFHLPFSIVTDQRGIYYDPRQTSDLEAILAETEFGDDLLARAERLIAQIVARGISKYGVATDPVDLPARDGRRLVLVGGQVEDDASVAAGGGDVAGNLDLLKRARATEPEAEIWFRPHPDVDAGHRFGKIPDEVALQFADHVVRAGTSVQTIMAADCVHVLTSLMGFEALMRGKQVVTHGQPFFASWGLTNDLAAPVARRVRRLTLAELVAGTLIIYPRYLDPATGLPCPPEVLVHRLSTFAGPKTTALIQLRTLQGRLFNFVRSMWL